MITYRKQILLNATTAASTTNFVIYQLNINSIATYKMADVEIITSLYVNNNVSTIYYRKLQLVDPTLNPSYANPQPINIKNSSFNFVEPPTPTNLYLSEISYDQNFTNAGNIQIKTTNPTLALQSGNLFAHFKINFY
jgi:hypothetical protein